MERNFHPINLVLLPRNCRPELGELEKIEVIFAEGYVEKMNYVEAAKELPKLTDERLVRERVRNMASWMTRIMKRWKSMSAPMVLVLHNLSCKERYVRDRFRLDYMTGRLDTV
ncbi:hypothetical protein EMCG_06644 [[Emmonsia] crescens]|uniref:Uncharacterized protein n=1 Tax=[Emmonsia] crescens TaxID=73230 RepID=A0A0G2IBD7_9EURO|nr:hypothetical protein EMCG_06644 [Emmonsia crescens UAMH 3008]